jgi:hypothetical protein
MRFFHGTDLDSARRMLSGEELNAATAGALKTDGPPGFFLAVESVDAEFFALRQLRGPAAVLAIDISPAALGALMQLPGVIRRPIPRGPRSPRFAGDEIVVPPEAFDRYNEFRRSREIVVLPAP